MNATRSISSLSLIASMVLVGCSTAYVDKSKGGAASTTPLQDAVFFEVNPEFAGYEPRCINILPFTDEKGLDKEGNFRKAFHAQLSVTGVRLIPLQAKNASVKTDCDLELRGKVLENHRLFMGVYSEYRAGAEVELYNTQTKKYFWRAHHSMVKRSGGLPLDIFSALASTATAAMNLESAQTGRITFELADRIVKAIPNLVYREEAAPQAVQVAARQSPDLTPKNDAQGANLPEQKTVSDLETLQNYLDQRQYARAAEFATQLIETKPDNKDIYALRGQAHAALGRPESAIKDYIKAIALGDEREDAYTRLGSAYGALGRFDLAVAAYDKVMQKNPSNLRTLLLSGVAQAADGDPEKAYDKLRRVLVISLSRDDLSLAKRAVNAMHSTGTFEMLSETDKRFVATKF